MKHEQRGFSAGVAAYALWGILPVYWKLLKKIPAIEILAHRVIWSLILVVLILYAKGKLRPWLEKVRSPRTFALYLCSSILIALNWGIFIYAVEAGEVLQSSLGYFISPLLYVVVGSLVLKERLSRLQKTAVSLMTVAVFILAISRSEVPTIALGLAASFVLYGFLRKRGPLASLESLCLETGILAAPALVYLGLLPHHTFLNDGLASASLLVFSGPVTTIPLLLFAIAAKALPLKTLGILQFIAPSIQFFLAVLLYRESFSLVQLVSFSLIWCALALYIGEPWILLRLRHAQKTPSDTVTAR